MANAAIESENLTQALKKYSSTIIQTQLESDLLLSWKNLKKSKCYRQQDPVKIKQLDAASKITTQEFDACFDQPTTNVTFQPNFFDSFDSTIATTAASTTTSFSTDWLTSFTSDTASTTTATEWRYRYYTSTSLDGLTTWTLQFNDAFLFKSKKEHFRNRIHHQLNHVSRRRAYLDSKVSAAELKARDTLRDMLTETEWRRYVTNSFVMVKGGSGRWYQIFSNHNKRIKVWEKGKCIAELCIHTADECPPTDHVINMKVLIELDEQAVWNESNATWFTESRLLA